MVDTIEGAFGFLEAKITSKKIIFIWKKRVRRYISCDMVYLFIDIVISEISFVLYLSVFSESIETHTLTKNGKLFNEWITQKQQKE